MQYNLKIARYIENVKKCEEYNNIPNNLDKDAYIKQLIDNNIKISEILAENNELLNDIFYKYKDSESLDKESYDRLKYFARELYDKLLDHDFGLIFEVYCLITKYAHDHLDLDEQLENEYYITHLNYYFKLNFYPYRKQLFKAYYSVDDETYFKLNKQSRSYYIRLKSNIFCGFVINNSDDITIKVDSLKDIVEFIHREDVRNYDDFPFDTWARLALINLNIVISAIREKGLKIKEEDRIKLLELSEYYNPYMDFDIYYSKINYLISYTTLLYHLEKIDFDTLIDSFRKMLEIKNDASIEQNLSTRLRIANNIVAYLYLYRNDYDKCKMIHQSCMDELNHNKDITRNVLFDRLYQHLAITGVMLHGFENYKEQLFQSMILRHSTTYIHSSMVKEIAEILLEEYINKHPKFKDQGYEMIVSDCALFHDIGKFNIMPIIKVNHRFLTRCELDQIFLHPEYGLEFLKDADVSDYIKEAILFHHQSYDETRGYPKIHNDRHSLIVDIIRIADCLDAASDHIGRPFNKRKSFDEVYQEFKNVSNTQYSADIVDLLEDDDFRNKLENKIRTYRENLYYQKYQEKHQVKDGSEINICSI